MSDPVSTPAPFFTMHNGRLAHVDPALHGRPEDDLHEILGPALDKHEVIQSLDRLGLQARWSPHNTLSFVVVEQKQPLYRLDNALAAMLARVIQETESDHPFDKATAVVAKLEEMGIR